MDLDASLVPNITHTLIFLYSKERISRTVSVTSSIAAPSCPTIRLIYFLVNAHWKHHSRSTMLEIIFAVLFLSAVIFALLGLTVSSVWHKQAGEGLVQVIVLGDAGRSPRMQYHSLSLVKNDFNVDLIGYGGSQLIQDLRESQRLKFHALPDTPEIIRFLPTLPRYFLKVFFQMFVLFWTVLVSTKKPAYMLVQTPPAIPTLFVVVIASWLRGSKLIMDYHNYAHSLMALTLGPKHSIVLFSRWYERIFSHYSYANLCVSEAMKKDLKKTFDTNAIILYDRPPGMFKRTPIETRHELFCKLAASNKLFCAESGSVDHKHTLFTKVLEDGSVTLQENRPFLIISSTSWTEDEDFSILLEALERYNEKACKGDLPSIMCIITGKGPLKSYYERIIAKKEMKKVVISTLWLSAEDYPLLLGSADLGVCLHKSSSGLDLPMKVVDMFGSGLPVCAIHFGCLHELLRHDHNGYVFHNDMELADQIEQLVEGFPAANQQLAKFRDNLSSFQSLRWDHYWKLHVLPLLSGQ